MSRRTILAAGVVCGLCACAHAGPLQVAVTLTDLTPLVQAVGGDAVVARCVVPAGGDPHSFTLSADTAAALQHADLVVFAGTPFLEFEAEIKRSVPGKPSCDWADYEARGARLSDVPGIAQNPHGFWLHLDNAAAIARAVADRILELRPGAGQVRPNLMSLEHELRTCRQVGRELVAQTGGRRPWVAVVPGVADSILNLDLPVGMVLLPTEGAGFASARDVDEAVRRLRSGEWAGLVCARSARGAKPAEVAEQIARDAHSRVVYVSFLDPLTDDRSYLGQAYFNAAAMAAGGTTGPETGSRLSPRVAAALVGAPALVVILLLALALMRAARAARTALPGAGIFGDQ
jgi:ABC-type Zn uptake system ZnuABC Zn-binding protein ZnuA